MNDAYRNAPGSGAAAFLAFATIALIGYLGYSTVFLIQRWNIPFEFGSAFTWQFCFPTFLALLIYFPTDPLTRVLARVGVAAGIVALIVIQLKCIMDVRAGNGSLIHLFARQICALFAAFAASEVIRPLVLPGLPVTLPKLPLRVFWIVLVVYCFGSILVKMPFVREDHPAPQTSWLLSESWLKIAPWVSTMLAFSAWSRLSKVILTSLSVGIPMHLLYLLTFVLFTFAGDKDSPSFNQSMCVSIGMFTFMLVIIRRYVPASKELPGKPA